MLIHKMCQECTHNTQGKCEGKTANESRTDGKPPCKKYQLDMSLIEDAPYGTPIGTQQDTTAEQVPLASLPGKEIDEAIANAPAFKMERIDGSTTIIETKHQKFKRLSKKRLHTTLDNIRKITNLTNKAVYEWNETDKKHIVSTIRKAVDKLENKL